MPSPLRVIDVTPEDIASPAVQRFECGTDPWQQEVATWIKGGPGGVLDALAQGCQVWLYVTDDEGLIGYSSLAQTNWRYPTKNDPRAPINIIPYTAVQSRFWRQPDGPVEGRYSTQIMRHLVAEACKHTDRLPLLTLYVHPQNTQAVTFYQRMGFKPFSMTYHDRETNVVHISMILNLPVPPPACQ